MLAAALVFTSRAVFDDFNFARWFGDFFALFAASGEDGKAEHQARQGKGCFAGHGLGVFLL